MEVGVNGGHPYMVVCKNKTELPNYGELSEVNGDVYWKFEGHNSSLTTHTLNFELTETTDVCLGFTASMPQNSCFKVKELQLVYKSNAVQ